MRKIAAFAALATVVPAALSAQDDVVTAATPVSHAKSYQLSKVLLDTTSNKIQGKLRGGTLCVFPSKIDPLVTGQKKTQDLERYDVVFAEAMAKRGFKIVSDSQTMFSGASDKKGDYLIGATLRPHVMDICSSVNGIKGRVMLDVEWQIFDLANQKVIETVTTSGTGDVLKFDHNGMTLLENRAFESSLIALIDQGILGKYAGIEPTGLPHAAAPPSPGEPNGELR